MRLISLNQLAWMTALGLGACTTTATASRAQVADAQPDEAQAEAGLREHHRHQHRGGVMQFVAMSLDTLGPDDAERPQVEALQRDLYACMAPAGEIQRQLHLTVADGVAAGAVDLAKVDGLIGQLDLAAAAVRGCSVNALNQLHALLTPVERAELVEKVQAHYEVWRQVNHEDDATGRGPGGRLTRLATELALTPDQVERITASLHTALGGHGARFDPAREEARMQEFSQAFAMASYDARSSVPSSSAGIAAHGASRMAIFYETVTPLLTAGQRATLADQLRQHAGQHPRVSTR
jgi:Spy/CpxP family protein refolding chaperone